MRVVAAPFIAAVGALVAAAAFGLAVTERRLDLGIGLLFLIGAGLLVVGLVGGQKPPQGPFKHAREAER